LADIVTKPFAFRNWIDWYVSILCTNIATVQQARQKLSKNYCFLPPFSDDVIFLFFWLKI